MDAPCTAKISQRHIVHLRESPALKAGVLGVKLVESCTKATQAGTQKTLLSCTDLCHVGRLFNLATSGRLILALTGNKCCRIMI
jgi:hypothetical protein